MRSTPKLVTPAPLDVDAARRSFQLPDDLVIELVAAEPHITDPVAIRFDERGRLWVVQMGDYPHGPDANQPPVSKISILEDRDGDGYFETATVFREQLLFPTGLQPWKGGVIVTLAGRVVWMKDTDGDGRCDHEETWFEGFAEGNSQLRANHPTLALDNTVYIANGLRGGEVRDVRLANSPVVSIRNRDFRFDPLGSFYEPVSGLSQFGLTFDDFGRRFLCSNRHPCRHVVIEDRYLARNPQVLIPDTVHDVAASAEQSRLYPLTRAWTTSNLHAHQFTAACGVLWFGGTGLGPSYRGDIFVCDPTGNLVHREVMEATGATFRSCAAYTDREFLASTDEWFRPVNLEVGPDGALYVVDMYRAVIEHPEFMPDELKQREDLLWGQDRGRIWRVRSRTASVGLIPQQQTTMDWLAGLEQANSWHRETAARLIIEHRPAELVEPLTHMARHGRMAASRCRALWLLRALGALSEELLVAALADEDSAVREQALILSESFRDDPAWRQRIRQMSSDPAPRVRFQVALWLVPVTDTEEVSTLWDILRQGADDLWTRRAVLLAAGRHVHLLLRWAITTWDRPPVADATHRRVCTELAELVGRLVEAREDVLDELLEAATHGDPRQRRTARLALSQLLTNATAANLRRWQQLLDSSKRKSAWERLETDAASVALDTAQPLDIRREALELARFGASGLAVRELCLRDTDDTSLRVLAIRDAAHRFEAEFWQKFIERFRHEVPAVRTALIDAALNQPQWAAMLADALERGQLRVQEIPPADFARLERHRDPQLRLRFGKLATERTPHERQQALARYEPALQLEGDPYRGRLIFTKSCSACHRVGGIGVDVAPDISDSRTKTPQQLLTDIVQPNRAIDANYISYVVQTTDGRVLTGIIASETGNSITLRQAENITITISRNDIETVYSTGQSLMPEGLEENLSLQDMADLIAFVKNWRYLETSSTTTSNP